MAVVLDVEFGVRPDGIEDAAGPHGIGAPKRVAIVVLCPRPYDGAHYECHNEQVVFVPRVEGVEGPEGSIPSVAWIGPNVSKDQITDVPPGLLYISAFD